MTDDQADVAASAPSAWGSLLSVQDFAAITSVGFRPVGHVLGAAVIHLGFVSHGGKCARKGSATSRTYLASDESGPFNLLLRRRYGARRQALRRAIEQCEELGGDGIVGVTLSVRPFPAGGTEFSLQGTAVRAVTETRPAAPFSSHLSAPELARLLRAGWVPTELVFGISLGARHDDMRTRDQTRRRSTGEIRSYSELIRDTRRDARDQLAKAVAAQGADGVVVDDMQLHIGERECPTQEGMHDHVAEATILGTTIAAFGRPAASQDGAPLTILHLNHSPAATANLRPDSATEPPPQPDSEGGVLDRLMSARAARRASRSTISGSDSAGITKAD